MHSHESHLGVLTHVQDSCSLKLSGSALMSCLVHQSRTSPCDLCLLQMFEAILKLTTLYWEGGISSDMACEKFHICVSVLAGSEIHHWSGSWSPCWAPKAWTSCLHASLPPIHMQCNLYQGNCYYTADTMPRAPPTTTPSQAIGSQQITSLSNTTQWLPSSTKAGFYSLTLRIGRMAKQWVGYQFKPY